MHNFHHLTAFTHWQLIGFAFFKLRQCHSKKPFNHFLPALLLFGLNPLILFSLANIKAHCLSFVAVIGKPDFATSHILSANSPSSLLDSIFGLFLPPVLCPSPSTPPVRWFLKYKSVQGQSRSRGIRKDQGRSKEITVMGGGVSNQIKLDQDGSKQIRMDQGRSKEINVICG